MVYSEIECHIKCNVIRDGQRSNGIWHKKSRPPVVELYINYQTPVGVSLKFLTRRDESIDLPML